MTEHASPWAARPSSAGSPNAAGRESGPPPLVRWALAHPMVVAFGVALVPRLVFLFQLRANSPTFNAPEGGDEILYDRLASGASEPLRAYFHSPLYIGFVKVFYSLFGRDLTALRLLQHVLGAAACALVVWVALRIFRSRPVALAAGLVAAFIGPVLFYEGQICIDGLMPLLVMGCAAICLSLPRGASPARWGFAGLALGITALGRPVIFAWIPILVLWALMRPGGRVRSIGPLLAGVAIVIAPVTIRNILAEGDFVLISANGGLNLYIGNNEIANGQYVLPYGLSFRKGDPADDFRGQRIAETSEGKKLTSAQTSAWWVRRAWVFIRAQPVQVLRLMVAKAELLANNAEITQLNDYDVYGEVAPVLRALPTAVFVMAPGLAGMVLLFVRPRRRDLSRRYALLVLAFGASFLPFFIVGRYRAPVLFLMAPFAAYWAAEVVAFFRASPRSALVPVGLCAVAFWATTREVMKPSPAYQYMDFAETAMDHGDRASAMKWCKRSIERDPMRVDAAALLGQLLREAGRNDEAAQVLADAIRRAPEEAPLRRELGRVFEASGRGSDAITLLRASLDQDPRSIATWQALVEALHRAGMESEAAAADRSLHNLLPIVKADR